MYPSWGETLSLGFGGVSVMGETLLLGFGGVSGIE